jgi:hypothetical protein
MSTTRHLLEVPAAHDEPRGADVSQRPICGRVHSSAMPSHGSPFACLSIVNERDVASQEVIGRLVEGHLRHVVHLENIAVVLPSPAHRSERGRPAPYKPYMWAACIPSETVSGIVQGAHPSSAPAQRGHLVKLSLLK